VKWTSAKIYVFKSAIIGTALLYMVLDLWVLRGPMYGFLHKDKQAAEAAALVYGERIPHGQLARHKAEQEAVSGREKTNIAMMMDLVRSSLLRLRTRYNDNQLPHDRAAAEKVVSSLSTRAGSNAVFEQQLASQGYTRRQFTDKVESRLMELALLDRNLAPHTQVDNAAIMAHYKQLKEEMTIPASRPVKHIFIASLNRSAADARRAAELVMSRLDSGEGFADLAAEVSEDEATASRGGNLGTVYDDALLPLPELNLFGENALPAGTPTLAESQWGWHVILAGPITPAYTPSLDECRETLRTAIISAQRELGVNTFFDTLIKEAHRKQHIQIHVK
jgi:parvulin-like peptidyl-prolyl isomerase